MPANSRTQIFTALHAALPQSSPLPDLPAEGPWKIFKDPYTRFVSMVESVGGTCTRAATSADANRLLADLTPYKEAVVRCSLVPNVGDSTFDLDSVADPHELHDVDFAVLPGEFGVAENGAIWVTDNGIPHRVLYFLPQHLSIVIPAAQIVHNMHEAYARITPQQHAWSGFISGPSKTADIEQSLVIGAHGARSLTVIAVEAI